MHGKNFKTVLLIILITAFILGGCCQSAAACADDGCRARACAFSVDAVYSPGNNREGAWLGAAFASGRMNLAKPQAEEPVRAYTTANTLNLRSLPNTKSAILRECAKYTPVEIIAQVGEWYRVSLADGSIEGYMLAKYIKNGEPPASTQAETPVKTLRQADESTVRREQTVYITNTGSKYHRGGCRYLRKSKIAIDLSDARERGYTACSVCY